MIYILVCVCTVKLHRKNSNTSIVQGHQTRADILKKKTSSFLRLVKKDFSKSVLG